MTIESVRRVHRLCGHVALRRSRPQSVAETGPLTVEGPFHVVDAAHTQHVGQLAADWVVDVDYRTAQRWGCMPWVTVDEPPLELLLATDAMPWTGTPPADQCIHPPPHSAPWWPTLVAVPDQTVKKPSNVTWARWDFVDAMSDAPDYLYVK
ncbi:MAG: hypothetical protein R3A10_19565 [Caldilineaceae bacterium]